MLKSIFFVALAANVLILVSSQGTIGCGGDPNARCGTDCGKHCDSNKDKGPFPCPQICIPGLCDCNPGYIFDDNANKCVLPEDCKCKKNEQYSSCVNGGCFPIRNCTYLGKPQYCVKIDPKYCKGGCICAEGYLRNTYGKCIPEELCCDCKKHEHYSNCTNGGCFGARHCYEKGKPVECHKIDPEFCIAGCLCDKGYLRDKYGNCIPEHKCEPVCGKNEEYSNCTNGGYIGARNCSELGKPIRWVQIDPKNCKGGCLCKKGYLRNKYGKCIPEELCCDCKENEHYSNCTNGGCYGARHCYEKGKPVKCYKVCPKDCIKGCLCDKGYLRDKYGNCIPEKKCEPVCGKNEEYSNCTNGGYIGARNCSELGKPIRWVQIDPKNCKGGCLCKKGYLRNKYGKCIPEELCCDCKENEHYSNCTNGGCYGARHCYEKGKPVKCYKVCPKDCIKGCLCDKGYLRDKYGNCIPEKKCEPVCGKNEEYSNCTNGGYIGARNCSELGKPIRWVQIDPKNCKGGCLCKKGYLRNKYGKCIPEELCCDCKENEHYSNCTNGGCYGARHCYEKGKPVKCYKVCPKDCIKGCLCDKGYLRDKYGNCIPEKKCEPVCGKNEEYSNCTNGGYIGARNCSELGKPIRWVQIDPKNCKGGCLCKKGYLRNKYGKCIPEELCCDCKENEHYSNCTNGGCYGARHCYEKGKPVKCYKVCPKDCIKGCLCDKGYLRDKYGNCIPEKKCEPVCGKNEEYSNCTNGGYIGARNCSELGKPIRWVQIDPKNCKGGCLCKKGFLRNKYGKCIPEELCCDCKENEHYSNCTNGGCFGARYCYEKGKPVKCHKIDPKDCKKGCLCDKGYLRDKYGNCIPEKKCPAKCTKPHEYYEPCVDRCPEPTCKSIGKNCSDPEIDSAGCRGACRCEPGYYRNWLGECISKKDCLKCTGPHEYFSCGGACDNVCATLSKQNQTKCLIINIKCNEKCYCEEGYARNAYNICVPFKDCEKCKEKCGVNEYCDPCPPRCSPQSCDKRIKYRCLAGPAVCIPACRCKKGYLRNNKGICVPEKKCECKGDPNAEPGCGNNCGRLCSDYRTKNVTCGIGCQQHGCNCKKGFVYEEYLKKCVTPEKCLCGKNEVYSSCINGGCIGARNCTELGKPVICVKIDPKYCKGGCLCKEGYLRDKNGNCIPEELCCDCKPHEHYSNCTNGGCFGARYCYEKGKPVKCHKIDPKDCKKGCLCDKGYLRDKYGNCIPEKKCEPVCRKNEVYSNCTNGGCIGARNCTELGKPVICVKIDPKYCKGGCICKEGYLRDRNGNCIPEELCCDCKEHEHYSNCTNGGCYGARHCYEKGKPVKCYKVCPKDCIKGCLCDKGYLRDKNGNCIPEKKCPPKCNKPNEVYEECPPKCPYRTCGIDDRLIRCGTQPEVGDPDCPPPGCICASGYFRHPNGDCVKWEQCPKCTKPHEYYEPCVDRCPEPTCKSIGRRCDPVKDRTACRGACRCEPGYYRNYLGECISKKDCLRCTGPHEYFSCRGACDNVCATLSQQNQTNCPIKPYKCVEMCYCEEGYARNVDNICVPFKDCGCKGDPNAKPGCGNCGRLCSNYDSPKPIVCKLLCRLGDCTCKEGYVYDTHLGKCVLPEDCYDDTDDCDYDDFDDFGDYGYDDFDDFDDFDDYGDYDH